MSSPPSLPDRVAHLVQRALAGDRAGVDELVRRVLCPLLEARVARHLARCRGSRHDLADRVQQILLRLFEDDAAALRRWDPARGSLSAYVGTIADHAMISELRRPAQPEEEVADEVRSPDSGPESKIAFQSLLDALVVDLDEDDFTLFRLAFVEELDPDEVAAVLQIGRQAVYKRLQRLRPRLRTLCDRLLSNPEAAARTSIEDRP